MPGQSTHANSARNSTPEQCTIGYGVLGTVSGAEKEDPGSNDYFRHCPAISPPVRGRGGVDWLGGVWMTSCLARVMAASRLGMPSKRPLLALFRAHYDAPLHKITQSVCAIMLGVLVATCRHLKRVNTSIFGNAMAKLVLLTQKVQNAHSMSFLTCPPASNKLGDHVVVCNSSKLTAQSQYSMQYLQFYSLYSANSLK